MKIERKLRVLGENILGPKFPQSISAVVPVLFDQVVELSHVIELEQRLEHLIIQHG